MKINPKLSNVVLIYLNTTFKSTLRNSTKFEFNKYNAINIILAFNADSSSALADHGFFSILFKYEQINNNTNSPIGVRERLRAINLKHKWMTVDLLV